ncbi:hypothetical protein [Mesorhizobium sp.]|uniref:hypothetical protein n=1 Tax=Mesorhizobium sp. TaxID=1871066 RepID=UPI000FEAA6BA|nr:hypothetical protein [Mesorhizobium sp.]RWO90886.1 MAG: hypothetical protein EOQ95_13500 [Mesorhizobium sp.]
MNAPLNPGEALVAAAGFSPEIADWISLQLKAGRRPSEILLALKSAVDLVRFERGGKSEVPS